MSVMGAVRITCMCYDRSGVDVNITCVCAMSVMGVVSITCVCYGCNGCCKYNMRVLWV